MNWRRPGRPRHHRLVAELHLREILKHSRQGVDWRPGTLPTRRGSRWPTIITLLPLALFARVEAASAEDREWAATVYVAQISGEEGWEDVMVNPAGSSYVDDYLVVAALSSTYARYREGALQLEAEGQVAYNFGEQHHWEFNAVPIVARWQKFPWNHTVATSAAFGVGLSYATEVPEIEVELEGESAKLLIYWLAEITAGPVDGPWAVSLRLHHRSVAYGLLGEEGGMNGVGLGLRYRF